MFLRVSAAAVIGALVVTAQPPTAPVRPVKDLYHGMEVVDPYRYMENLHDSEVEAWFKAQNDYARAALAAIPARATLLKRLQELMDSVPTVDAYRLPGGVYLILKMLPGDDTKKAYLRRGLNGDDRLLLDPRNVVLAPRNQQKGKNEISGVAPSGDGKYMIFGITPGGSEENTELHVIEAATGRETDDVLSRGVGAEAWHPSWLPDNHSFVYGRLQDLPPGAPAAAVRQKFRSYLHVLGTPVSQDRPVFGYGIVPSIEVDPSLIASVMIPPGARYALGCLNGSVTRNSAYYIAPADSVGKANTPWRKIAGFDDGVTSITVHEDELYLLTYKDAPRFKVLRTDARKPDLTSAEAVVPQGEPVIQTIGAAQDALYVRLLDGGPSRVLRVAYGPKPKVELVPLPYEGSVEVDTDGRLPGALFWEDAWTRSLRVFEYDPVAKRTTDTKIQPLGPFDDPPGLIAEEVKVRSLDGTMVPLSILRKKDLRLDGSNPAYLWGYGAYGTTQEPGFNRMLLAWLERDGIYSVCHVRGGGEYGEDWHVAGKGPSKPNTWKDFIACGEYLVAQGYTTPARLSGEGASMGGVLIGRAITERPDLFGAAIINVGLADTLRAELTDNGQTNIPEIGSVKTEEGFHALYEMSTYHHVKDGTRYPAVLLMTGSNDPRVDPWHAGKLAARLQAATASGKPVLLRVDYGAGHGSGGGKQAMLEATADLMSFLLWQAGAPGFQAEH